MTQSNGRSVLEKKDRTFLILCRAFCLGLITTNHTLPELMKVAEGMSDEAINDLTVRVVEVENV